MEGKDVDMSDVKELESPDISALMLSATLLPFPQLVQEAPEDQNALLISIIDNLERSLPLTRKNVRTAATAAFASQSSSNPATGQTSDFIEDIDQEHIGAQNEEMVSWLSTPPSADAKYAIAPGQSYKPVLKKRTASGSTKLSEGSLAGTSTLRTTKSRIDDLVKQHDDHAKHIFKYYCDAYERRMGKPWSSRRGEVLITTAGAMQDVPLATPSESETPTLKWSSTLPNTLGPHPRPIVRAATIALEPSAAVSFRTPLSHVQSTSHAVSVRPQEPRKKLDALMNVQRKARAEWVLATDPDRKRELYDNYSRAKDDRKRFKSSIRNSESLLEEEEEDSDVNTAQECAMSHLQHLHPTTTDSPTKPRLQSVYEDSSRRPSLITPISAQGTFKISEQDSSRQLDISRRPSVETTTSDESSTAPSKPTVDPRRRPSVSIGRPMNAGRPNLPKLATNVFSTGIVGPASAISVSATPISATPTTDPRRRPISANGSATQTSIMAGGSAAPVVPMLGSAVTPTSGIEALQIQTRVDKARDPRRRHQ